MNKKSLMLPVLLSRSLKPWLLPESSMFVSGRAVARIGNAYSFDKFMHTKVNQEYESKLNEPLNEGEQSIDATSEMKQMPMTTISECGEEVTMASIVVDGNMLDKTANGLSSVAAVESDQDIRDKLDEQMRQVQEQLRRQKDRDAQQRKERMERHRQDIIKMQENRPAVQKKVKIDLGELPSKGIFCRQERLNVLLKECNDVNTLADMVVRLTRDLEDDRLKYKSHMEEYYELISTFTTAKKRLTNEIAEAKATANKQIINELLDIVDSVENAANDADLPLDNVQAQNLRGIFVNIDKSLKALFKRHEITEIDAKGKQFDHTYHQLSGESIQPDVPVNTVLEVSKKGYLLRDQCIRLAHVIVARHK